MSRGRSRPRCELVAEKLEAHVRSQGGEILLVHLGYFYATLTTDAEVDEIKLCKSPGDKEGIQSFVRLHLDGTLEVQGSGHDMCLVYVDDLPLDGSDVDDLESVIDYLRRAKFSDCSSVDEEEDAGELEPFLLHRGVIASRRKASRFSLANLEQALQDWRVKTNCSIKALKKELSALAIHLGTGAYFGQQRDLVMAILRGKHKRVGRDKAKEYHLVKNCLVVLT